MNRSFVKVLVAVVLISIVPSVAFGEYDSEKVVGVMRTNRAQMGEIGKAIVASDWHAAAAAYWKIAEGALEILPYTPPRGSKADWENTMEALIFAAYEGIGAAGAKDADAMQTAFNKQGHGDHK